MSPRVKKTPPRRDENVEKRGKRTERVDRRGGRGPPGGRSAMKTTGGKALKDRKRLYKSRSRARGGKSARVKLKGWLATPSDWARFDAWAKVNAQPKRTPEPEAIIRPAKPLSQLRKRLKVLAQHREAPDPTIHCKLDHSVSKAALEAVASIRTNLLALPNIRLVDFGRVFYQVSPAALTYEPSERIIELSRPQCIRPEKCKPPRMRMCQPKRTLDRERLKELARQKRWLRCPEQLTKQEFDRLFTPYGTRWTALDYKITPWMDFLALPPYKKIRHRKDEDAASWKKKIISEGEIRGRQAMVEYKKRRAEQLRRERMLRLQKMKQCKEEEERRKLEEERERSLREGRKDKECDDGETPPYRERLEEVKSAKREPETRRRKGRDPRGAMKQARVKVEKKLSKEEEEKKRREKERRERRRKRLKHAWRFAPHPCKEDAFLTKKEALEVEASSRTNELAKEVVRKSKSIRANPFVVRKGALSASASARVQQLANPNRPRSPVKRRPPREKDAYGRPIFVIPVYGKVLPKTKPYKMADCPPEDEEKKKKDIRKTRPIDPIAYEPTYDPCIYPDQAKRQKRERDRAAKLPSRRRNRRRRNRKMEHVSRTTIAEDGDV